MSSTSRWRVCTTSRRTRWRSCASISTGGSMLAAHQTDAVERVLNLLSTRRGALLADDVGLGKSFIAAEVMRRFDRVDLIVPAALVEQWRETLRSFDVRANLVTHDGVVRDPFFPEPCERVVVVDEAH